MPFGVNIFSQRGRISHPPGGYESFSFEESELKIPELERDEDLIAGTTLIVMTARDAQKIMAGPDTQLHSMTIAIEEEEEHEYKEEEEQEDEEENEAEEDGVSAFQDRLNFFEEIIMRWEEDQSMIWDSGPYEAFGYLNAAHKIRQLIEKLETLSFSNEDQEYKILHRAYNILQTAMVRLEEEFRNLLIQNRKPFEFVSSSSRSIEEEYTTEGSSGVSSVESLQREAEHSLHLTHPDVIPHLKCIANLMLACNYDKECSRAYTIVRRDVLDERFFILEMDMPSIENVLSMEWTTLSSKIKRWIRVVQTFVRVYLANERRLCDQIFGEGEPISLVCFVNASKASMLQLLDFGEFVCIGRYSPENTFGILDMYEVLKGLLSDIDALYSDDIGSFVRNECREVLKTLGDSVMATFHRFEHFIVSQGSEPSLVDGGIHPLTSCVVNYVRLLSYYSETLNLLLKDKEVEDAILRSPDMNTSTKEDSASQVSSMAYLFRSIASALESKLHGESKVYEDAALQHLFLMNNMHYMAAKVEGFELRLIYGDQWIRQCFWKYNKHAMNYQRTSLWSILSLLNYDEFVRHYAAHDLQQIIVRECLKSFNLAFGDLYRIQTAWIIPDTQLREELRKSLSFVLIPAYRSFVGRHSGFIGAQHIKYSADDLQNYLLDFFEGDAKSL